MRERLHYYAQDVVYHLTCNVCVCVCVCLQHEDYDGDADGIPNDIAVVELQQTVNITNEYMGLAKLPRRNEEFAGTEHCWIAGWGRHSTTSCLLSILLLRASRGC